MFVIWQNICIFFLLFALSNNGVADFDRSTLNSPDKCKDSKNYYSETEIKVLWERGQLPAAFDNLEIFLSSVERLERQNQIGRSSLSCSISDARRDENQKANELQSVLYRITKSIQSSLISDLNEQKSQLQESINCFSRLDNECRNKNNLLGSEMKKRLYSMRIYMAIAQGVDDTSTPLKHDKSFLQELMEFSYGDRASIQSEISPLTTSELEKVRKIRNSATNTTGINRQKALEHYFAILGSTPALSSQDRELDLSRLNMSISHSLKMTEKQINEYREHPPQDLFLLLPYLDKALNEFSQPQLNVACQLVKYIYNNLEIRDNKFPTYLDRVLLLSSFSGVGAVTKTAGNSFKKELVSWANRLASRSLISSVVLSAQTIQKIKSGLNSCESGFKSQNELTSLCELQRVNSQADRLQNEIIVNSVLAGGFYGLDAGAKQMRSLIGK